MTYINSESDDPPPPPPPPPPTHPHTHTSSPKTHPHTHRHKIKSGVRDGGHFPVANRSSLTYTYVTCVYSRDAYLFTTTSLCVDSRDIYVISRYLYIWYVDIYHLHALIQFHPPIVSALDTYYPILHGRPQLSLVHRLKAANLWSLHSRCTNNSAGGVPVGPGPRA